MQEGTTPAKSIIRTRQYPTRLPEKPVCGKVATGQKRIGPIATKASARVTDGSDM
jgi:hypothetical protein